MNNPEIQRCLDALAEIVYGQGLRSAVWQRARLALQQLGITEAPKPVTDAARPTEG